MKYLLTLIIAFSFLMTNAQTPLGLWKSIDEKTGEAKSQVEIYEKDGKIYGKIVKLLLKPNDSICTACTGDRKGKRIVGLDIIEGMEVYKDYWAKGTIFNPEDDNQYKCSFWFEDNNTDVLFLRGKHWTGIYRTQKWYRVKAD